MSVEAIVETGTEELGSVTNVEDGGIAELRDDDGGIV